MRREEKAVEGRESLTPEEIEERSFAIIERELEQRGILLFGPEKKITERVIHASGDFEYAHTMAYSPGSVALAGRLLLSGADIVTDTNMALAGINKRALEKLGGKAHCFMGEEGVALLAAERKVTRASVAMELASGLPGPVIFVIGNAPTALMKIVEIMEKTDWRPDLVIGVPVGFVNVETAKKMIWDTGVPCIVNWGRKGGSSIAAAICNALLYGLERSV